MPEFENQVGDELRSVSSLQFHVDDPNYFWRGFVCQLDNPDNPKAIARLAHAHQTWMAVKAGDPVLMKDGKGRWRVFGVKEVMLYRCYPTRYCETVCESGQAWLDGKDQGEKIANRLPTSPGLV